VRRRARALLLRLRPRPRTPRSKAHQQPLRRRWAKRGMNGSLGNETVQSQAGLGRLAGHRLGRRPPPSTPEASASHRFRERRTTEPRLGHRIRHTRATVRPADGESWRQFPSPRQPSTVRPRRTRCMTRRTDRALQRGAVQRCLGGVPVVAEAGARPLQRGHGPHRPHRAAHFGAAGGRGSRAVSGAIAGKWVASRGRRERDGR
jgi:hypothetical protein